MRVNIPAVILLPTELRFACHSKAYVNSASGGKLRPDSFQKSLVILPMLQFSILEHRNQWREEREK